MRKRYIKDSRGFAPILVIIIVFVLVAVAAGIFVWRRNNDKTNKTADSSLQDHSASQDDASSDEFDGDQIEGTDLHPVPDTNPLITYVDLKLKNSGDESQLPENTPVSFRDFLKNRLENFDCSYEEFPEAGVYISKVSSNFVQGGIGCGGGAAVTWYLKDNEWHEFGYQDIVPCDTVVAYKIPSDFISDCRSGDEVIANPNGPLK